MFEWMGKKDIQEMALKNIRRVVKEKGCLIVEKNHEVKTVHLQFKSFCQCISSSATSDVILSVPCGVLQCSHGKAANTVLVFIQCNCKHAQKTLS